MTGFRAGTGKPVQVRWPTMYRVEDGCIVESYPQINLLPLFEQPGQLPPHSLELMLGCSVLR
jgi:hypothetical protein